MIKYSIVIPTYNHLEDCLKPCINSILKFTDLEETEIIIVANGCTDGTYEYVNSLPQKNIRVLWSDDPLGYTKSTNIGMQKAKGKYVVLLNNDTEILDFEKKNRWLEILEQPFLEDEKIAITGPLWGKERYGKFGFIIFFCAMIRKTVIDEIGFLDEVFNPGGGEDSDYCIRAQQKGYKIMQVPERIERNEYQTAFPIYHAAEKTVHELDHWEDIFERNTRILESRWGERDIKYVRQNRQPNNIKHSIIIPTYNHLEDCLKPCVESILANTDLIETEIIIMANGCTDGTEDYVKGLNHQNVILHSDPEPQGFIKPTNMGIQKARGEYIVLLNNDTEILNFLPRNEWLNMLRKPFEGDNKVAVTTPIKLYNYSFETYYAMFFCAMIPKRVFDEVGLLDENFGIGVCDDFDWCYRAYGKGYKAIQVPNDDFKVEDQEFHFPIYHRGEKTLMDIDYFGIVAKNSLMVLDKYNKMPRLKFGTEIGNKKDSGYMHVGKHQSYEMPLDGSDLSIFKNDSVKEICSVDFLSKNNVIKSLEQWHRILIEGGLLKVENNDNITNELFDFIQTNEYIIISNKIHNNKVQFLCRKPIKTPIYDSGNDVVRRKDIVEFCSVLGDTSNKTIIEVGCFRGESTDAFARCFKKVIAVDMWKNGYDLGDEASQCNMQETKDAFYKMCEKYDNIEVFEMPSEQASKFFKNESVDFVYIDANHQYDFVKQDIALWQDKVKDGSMLTGHDYTYIESVAKAVNETIGVPDIIFGKSNWAKRILRKKSAKIYDCFPFYNELEILEIRLNELYDVVDKFVIVDCNMTHSGKPKDYLLERNMDKFEKFKDKIEYLKFDCKHFINPNSWDIETSQRNHAMTYLQSVCKDNDIVISGDADEIPSASAVINYRDNYKSHMGLCKLKQKHHYYYLNLTNDSVWHFQAIGHWGFFKNTNFAQVRYDESNMIEIENGGWHFSFCGGANKIIEKIEAYAHTEYNNDKFKNINNVLNAMKNGTDLYHRDTELPYHTVQIDNTYPKYIYDNMEKLISNDFIKKNDDIGTKLRQQNETIFEEIVDKNCYGVEQNELSNKSVLDIGANIGIFDYFALKQKPKKTVSYEPMSEAFSKLKENMSGYDNLELVNMAIYNKNGTVNMSGEDICAMVSDNGEPVNCETLKMALNRFDSNDNDLVMKIDCEGSEFEILFSADKKDLLRFTTIYIEIHSHVNGGHYTIQSLIDYMTCLGYDCICIGDFFANSCDAEGNVVEHFTLAKMYKMKLKPEFYINNNTINNDKVNDNKDIIPITAEVSTRDRYYSTLPLCLTALANQTYKLKEVIIIDDGEQKDLRNDPLYQYVFSLFMQKGIEWKVLFGARKGQVHNHQRALEESKTSWILRVDDDEILEPDCLEKLVANISDGVGAIAGLVLDPRTAECYNPISLNKIKDLYTTPNMQWHFHKDNDVKDAEHLYSTFLYRKEASPNGYCLELSQVAHREETIFSHEIHRNGYKLLVDPKAVTWHYRAPEGGIRGFDHSLWDNDENTFKKKLFDWGCNDNFKKTKCIVLNNGMGDQWAFKMALPKIKQKYEKTHEILIATPYREIFEDVDGIKIIDLESAKAVVGDIEPYSIYRFMELRNWKSTMAEAFEAMYI